MDFEQAAWTAAAVAPFGLVMLGGGLLLLARRDRVGRPATVAGAVLVGLFAFNVFRVIAHEAAFAAFRANAGGVADLILVLNALGVFGSLVHAAGAVAVVRCVAISQRAEPRG